MKKVKMQLVGLNGNAFSILGEFSKNARRQDWDQFDIDAVLKDAMSGDYNHLLATILNNVDQPEKDEEVQLSGHLTPEDLE